MPGLPVQLQQTIYGRVFTFLKTQGKWGVPYAELTEGYVEHFAEGDISSVRHCFCLWEDRLKFMADMYGTSYYTPNTVFPPPVPNNPALPNPDKRSMTTNLTRILPEQHPEIPYLFASTVDTEGLGVPTSVRDQLADALTSMAVYANSIPIAGNLLAPLNAPTDPTVTPSAGYAHGGISIAGNVILPPLQQQDSGSNMVDYNLARFAVTYTPRDYTLDENPDALAKFSPANASPGLLQQVGIQPLMNALDINGNPVQNIQMGELVRYVRREYFEAAENQPIASVSQSIVFAGDKKSISQEFAFTLQTMELHLTWVQVPFPPWPAILAAVGKCNSNAFNDGGFGAYSAQTLLCLPPKFRRYRTGTGEWYWDIEYIFLWKPKGHNALLRATTSPQSPGPDGGRTPFAFERIQTTDNQPVIKTFDMQQLFVLV